MVCLLGLPVLSGCVNDMPASEYGNPAAAQKVLIAAQDTRFKREVLASLVAAIGSVDWYYRVIGLSQLAGQDFAEYGAILIMSPIEGGAIDKRVSSYLAKDPANPRAIVFYTYGIESLKDKIKWDYQVDAVSSASTGGSAGTNTDRLVALIRKRF